MTEQHTERCSRHPEREAFYGLTSHYCATPYDWRDILRSPQMHGPICEDCRMELIKWECTPEKDAPLPDTKISTLTHVAQPAPVTSVNGAWAELLQTLEAETAKYEKLRNESSEFNDKNYFDSKAAAYSHVLTIMRGYAIVNDEPAFTVQCDARRIEGTLYCALHGTENPECDGYGPLASGVEPVEITLPEVVVPVVTAKSSWPEDCPHCHNPWKYRSRTMGIERGQPHHGICTEGHQWKQGWT